MKEQKGQCGIAQEAREGQGDRASTQIPWASGHGSQLGFISDCNEKPIRGLKREGSVIVGVFLEDDLGYRVGKGLQGRE